MLCGYFVTVGVKGVEKKGGIAIGKANFGEQE